MNGTCDSQCQVIPVKCGDGVLEPGEVCDFPDPGGVLCRPDCSWACFWPCELIHPSTDHGTCDKDACASFSGADLGRCDALRACILNKACAGISNGTNTRTLTTLCFCSDGGACSRGADGPCVAQARALLAGVAPDLDTSDPIVLQDEADGAGLLHLIVYEAASALGAPTLGCRQYCPNP